MDLTLSLNMLVFELAYAKNAFGKNTAICKNKDLSYLINISKLTLKIIFEG